MTEIKRLQQLLKSENIDFKKEKYNFTPSLLIPINEEESIRFVYGASSFGIEAHLPNGKQVQFLSVPKALQLLKGGDL